MNTGKSLRLYEEILLLALRDEKGSIHFGINYQFALAGAIVAELILTEKITILDEKKKKFVKAISYKTTGDELLDEIIAKLRKSKRKEQVQTWVRRISNMPGLKHRVAKNLCRKGILRLEEDKVMLIFTRKLYPEINPKPEKEIIEKMRTAIFTDVAEIDPNTLVLIAICDSTGMLKPLFGRAELKARKSRIKEIVSGNVIGQATRQAVEAMQAAVMVATIIPVVAVTAAH